MKDDRVKYRDPNDLMNLKKITPVLLALLLAAIIASVTATLAVSTIEERSHNDVTRVLDLNGFDWADVDIDGLQVIVIGDAPDEATRFRALTTVGTVIDASRVIDMMKVAERAPVEPPRFSIEILRNDDGISLIGLIPASIDREQIVAAVTEIAGTAKVADLLETADFPVPDGWDAAYAFGMEALDKLERSKISISADQVELKAISDSISEKRKLETELSRRMPKGVLVALDITAPRPVITPFTLRFLIDAGGARFDACSTDTEDGREEILKAARDVGLEGKTDCKIGLGVPSPAWDAAVTTGITKLNEIGGGSITFSDADVTLIALESTLQATFDRVTGELEAALPEAFSLHAVLPEPVKTDGAEPNDGPPEFVATRSPEGHVQLRGRVSNERSRIATESFARAQFGSAQVNGAMRLDENLPKGWSTRVLASLEALSYLNNGSVLTQPDVVEIRGITGDPDARAHISRILSEKLGEAQDFRISVTYEKKLDPVLNLPTAAECVQKINLVLSVRQITFAPSSADIDHEASDTTEKIAEIMADCEEFPMEIGGHTDSQGREIMNQTLSQSRADAVLTALMARRVLTSNLTSKGYGESEPVADNKTEEGRELNRRIEFKLILPEDPPTIADAQTPKTENETTQTESSDEQN